MIDLIGVELGVSPKVKPAPAIATISLGPSVSITALGSVTVSTMHVARHSHTGRGSFESS
jgi:hypothetical protein